MQNSSQRALLLLSAVLIVGEHVAVFLWIKQAGGIGAAIVQTWAALSADWLIALILVDGAIFALLVGIWLWSDLHILKASRRSRALWVAATVVFGSAAVLAYFALREQSVDRGQSGARNRIGQNNHD